MSLFAAQQVFTILPQVAIVTVMPEVEIVTVLTAVVILSVLHKVTILAVLPTVSDSIKSSNIFESSDRSGDVGLAIRTVKTLLYPNPDFRIHIKIGQISSPPPANKLM